MDVNKHRACGLVCLCDVNKHRACGLVCLCDVFRKENLAYTFGTPEGSFPEDSLETAVQAGRFRLCRALSPKPKILTLNVQLSTLQVCTARKKRSKETYYSVKRDLLQCQKRPTTVSKDTYYSVKRDLLQCSVSRSFFYLSQALLLSQALSLARRARACLLSLSCPHSLTHLLTYPLDRSLSQACVCMCVFVCVCARALSLSHT